MKRDVKKPDQKSTDPAKQVKRDEKAAKKAAKKAAEAAKKTTQAAKKRLKMGKAGIVTSIVVAFVLAVSGIGIGVWTSANNRPPETVEEEPEAPEPEPEEPEEPELPEKNPDDLQAEPTISDNTGYQVAAYKPRFISIPSIGLYNIPVTELGTENGNQLSSPRSDYVVGWYYKSGLPGVPGKTALMNGHGGDLGTGILKNLPKIQIGAEITVEMGDGRKFTYAVADKVFRKIGAEADAYMSTIQESPRPGTASLSLITCTGTWLPAQRTYDQRLFVRALIK